MDIEVEYDIPVSPVNFGNRSKPSKYPFNRMKNAGSFFVECKHTTKSVDAARQGIYMSMRRHKISNPNQLFVTRKVANGLRCWRVK